MFVYDGVFDEFFNPRREYQKRYNIYENVSDGGHIPDIFQASFCGHNVSFVIDLYGRCAKIIGENATNYKIDLHTGGEGSEDDCWNLYPRKITITDDHGLKYDFEAKQEVVPYGSVSFLLYKIRRPNNDCLVELTYSQKGSYSVIKPYYETIGEEDYTFNFPFDPNPIAVFSSKTRSKAIYNQFLLRNYPEKGTSRYSLIDKFYPDTIKTKREIVTIEYGNRSDINHAKKIDKIIVTSMINDSIIHNVDFKYGYFSENQYDNSSLEKDYDFTSSYRRLKLTDVVVDGKKYSFGYYKGDLPSRLSMMQDYWGYYNGEKNIDGFCASPKYTYKLHVDTIHHIGNANRFADKDLCKVGTLNKIVYPTGGYSVFDFEVNHFDAPDFYYYPAHDSEIESVKRKVVTADVFHQKDSITFENVIGRNVEMSIYSDTEYYKGHCYNYEVWIRINKDNVFYEDYKLNCFRNEIKNVYLPKGTYSLYAEVKRSELIDSAYVKENPSMKGGYYMPNDSALGWHHKSSDIFEVTSSRGSLAISWADIHADSSIIDESGKSIGAGLRIKSIKNYDSNKVCLSDTRYKYKGGKLLVPTVREELITMGYSNIEEVQSNNLDASYHEPLTTRFYFVNSNSTYPEICSFGSPTVGYSTVIEEHYANDNLVSSKTDEYTNNSYRFLTDMNAFEINDKWRNGKLNESTTCENNDTIHNIKYNYKCFDSARNYESQTVFFPWCRPLNIHYAVYPEIAYKYVLYPEIPIAMLPSSITETFYNNNGNKTTVYVYNENNYQPMRVTVYDDKKQNSRCTCLYYPSDKGMAEGSDYLLQKHCLSEVVRTYVYDDIFNTNTFVGGYYNNYVLRNNIPVISECHSITPAWNTVLEMEVTKHDNYGNIREYKKKDGTPVTIIWAYNHQFPVMEIVGKTYSQVKNIYTPLTYLEEKYTTSEEIEESIEALHKALLNKEVMATAYEYSPWHTVKRIIKPNGYVVNYGYDDYGRLIETKDASGILQKYSYNYKNK